MDESYFDLIRGIVVEYNFPVIGRTQTTIIKGGDKNCSEIDEKEKGNGNRNGGENGE